jgi:hypothetical protein
MRTEAEILDALAKARDELQDSQYSWTERSERVLERIDTLEWVLENS